MSNKNDKNLAPIKKRIIELIEMQGVEKKKTFEFLGVSSSNFRGLALNSEVSAEVVAKILSLFPLVNPQWLLTGEGAMLKDEKGSIAKPNEDLTHVNEEASSYNRAKTSKNIVDEKHLLKKENKALVQDKIALMQDKMALIQQNSTLKEENITLKYKVKELEAQNNSLTTENTLLKKAQKSVATIQENKPELTTEK